MTTTITAAKLARQLYRDDLSRAAETPVEQDGERAYDLWLEASSDACDTDTREELEAVDRTEFAAAWNALAKAARERATELSPAIQKAIEHSVSHDEIGRCEATRGEIETLCDQARDSVDLTSQYGYYDVWGRNADGDDWRLHVTLQP